MTESRLVSVVVPSFNRRATIERCITSVLNQTYQNLEIVVVDDGSTDATVDIISSIADRRIKLIILERNCGAQAARNRGIQEAKGEWIAFQDSDDEWLPEKLEKQIEALKHNDYAPLTVVHTDCWRYDSVLGTKKVWNIWPPVEGANAYRRLLLHSGSMLQGILTSKEALIKIGLLDEACPSYQEWDTSIRLAKMCRFIHIREPLFIYHLHSAETISKDKKKDIYGYQYVVDKFRDEILLHVGSDTLNDHLISNARKSIKWGYFSDAVKILNKYEVLSLRIWLLIFLAKNKVNLKKYDDLISVYRRFKQKLSKLQKSRTN